MASGTKEEAFLTWMAENGFQLNGNLAFHSFPDTGRGIVAKKPIKKGDALFRVPRRCLLSPRSSPIADVLTELRGEDGDWRPLICAMMYEFRRPDSFWRPYLDMLPPSLPTPLFWPDRHLAELRGTDIEEKIGADSIKDLYDSTVPFLKAHPDLFDVSVHNLDLFKHMGSLVMAYSFTDDPEDGSEGDGVCMVPMADMLNAKPAQNNAELSFGADALAMAAVADIEGGSEVLNTYGELGNGELLRRYGYVALENPFDCVDLPLELVAEVWMKHTGGSEEDAEDRLNLLEEMEVLEPGYVIDREAALEPPEELLLLAEAMAADSKTFDALAESKDEKLLKKMLKARSDGARKFLVALLDARLAAYPTSLEEDKATFKDGQDKLEPHLYAALVVRISEKSLLTAAREALLSGAPHAKKARKA